MSDQPNGKVAFVLGGGGLRGGYEVGMLRALLEAGVTPDIIVGSSVGSIHGAMLAARPSIAGVERIVDMWHDIVQQRILRVPLWRKLAVLASSRTHIAPVLPFRRLLMQHVDTREFEDLAVPFHCAAAGIERASVRWFDSGPLIPAVAASCCVPGVWPPVKIGDEHFLDGGLVESIPISRAIENGATTVYVLHVGRINTSLGVPKWFWQAAMVSLEIARRQSFFKVMHDLPDGITVHVLPTGDTAPDEDIDIFDSTADQHEEVRVRIDNSYRASQQFLRQLANDGAAPTTV